LSYFLMDLACEVPGCVLGIAQQLGGESPLANRMEVKA
jgi:hypothetical protein